MPDTPISLHHPETPSGEDTALAQESRSHVANSSALQLVAELIEKLRSSRFSWWTPELLRGTWDAHARMAWFTERPDIRRRITCNLTGLKPKAARNKQPDYQAALIDSVIDDGDVAVDQFENEFDPVELAAYAPVAEIWHRFRQHMPWDQDIAPNQELVVWLMERLLASSSTIDGMTRRPILTPHDVRATIPGKIWHAKIPLDVRVTIDERRLERERTKPGEPFHATDDLAVATPAIIAANIPLQDLLCVFDVAEKAMGLASAAGLPAAARRPKLDEVARAEPPKVEQPARAERPKAAEPVAPPFEKAPEKPAVKPVEKPVERPAGRPLERWERMADRVVLEKEQEGRPAEKP